MDEKSEAKKAEPKKTLSKVIKKLKSLKKWQIIVIILLVIAVISAGVGVYIYKNESLNKGPGRVSKDELTDYEKILADYKNKYPDMDFGGADSQVALDDLLLNAAFKNEEKKRGETLTDEDLLKSTSQEFTDQAEKDKYIQDVKSADVVRKTRMENVAFRAKYADLLLVKKDLLITSVNVDAPFFNKAPADKVQSLYDDARSRLSSEMLPLFKDKASKEDICNKSEVCTFDEDLSDEKNWQQYFDKSVIASQMKMGYVPGEENFNDTDDISTLRGDIGKLEDTAPKISELKNVGDYTDIFASKTGLLMIVRLEGKNEGQYESWTDFLNKYKDTNATNKVSKVKSKLYNAANTVALTLTTPGLEQAKAQAMPPDGCTSHNVRLTFRAYVENTDSYVSGAQLRHYRANHNCGSQYTGTTVLTTGGQNAMWDNCWGPGPDWNLMSGPNQPSNGRYVKVSGGPYTPKRPDTASWRNDGTKIRYSTSAQNANDPSWLSDGFPDWNSGFVNENKNIYIFAYYRLIPDDEPDEDPPVGSAHIWSTCDTLSWRVPVGGKNNWFRVFRGSVSNANEIASGRTTQQDHSMPIDGAAVYGDGSSAVRYFVRLYESKSGNDYSGLDREYSIESPIQIRCLDYPPTMTMSADCNVVYIRGTSDANSSSRSLKYYGVVYHRNPDGSVGGQAATISGYTNENGDADVGWYAPPVNNDGYYVDVGLHNINRNGTEGDFMSVQRYQVGSCYSATCDVNITHNVGTGVKANNRFRVNYSITNHGNASMRAFDASAIGVGRGANTSNDLSFSNQGIGATVGIGATSHGSFEVTAPANISTHTLELYPNYGFPIGNGCSTSVKVFQPFLLRPTAGMPTALPNNEDPAKITYTAGVSQETNGTHENAPYYTGNIPGTNVSTSLFYYDSATGSQVYSPPDLHNQTFTGNYGSATYREENGLIFNDVTEGPQFRPGNEWKPGDQFCGKSYVNQSTGWIGPGNELASVDDDETQSCKTVLNYPYIRAYGADVMSGGTSGTIKARWESANSGAGSAAEFAALAAGSIDEFASASLRSSQPLPNVGLSFPSIGSISIAAPDYFESSKKSDTPDSGNVPSLSMSDLNTTEKDKGQTLIRKTSGKLQINGGQFTKRHALFVEGDVVINSNIEYNDGWASIEEIPAFDLIVKGNIYIASGVERLDGTFIAQKNGSNGGKIYTCAKQGDQTPQTYTEAELYAQCKDKQLRVNGAFVADDLKLLRAYKTLRDIPYTNDNPTAGTRDYKKETYRDDFAAESFRLSPEYFLARRALEPAGGPADGDFDYYVTLPPAL